MLSRELAWLQRIIEQRFEMRQQDQHPALDTLASAPDTADDGGPYAALVQDMALGAHQRLALILALAPHLSPETLDVFLLQNQVTGRRFSEFGGLSGQAHGGFLPTVDTALFLLAGANLAERLRWRALFAPQSALLDLSLLAPCSRARSTRPRRPRSVRRKKRGLSISRT